MATGAPASFSRQVTFFYETDLKPNEPRSHALWQRLIDAKPNFGKKFLADSFSCTPQLHRLLARLAPTLVCHDQGDDWDVVRNKRHGKG